MSLLLDALERADKARRPAQGAELGLEPRAGEGSPGAAGGDLPPPALKALFDLQGAPRRPSRRIGGWLLALLLTGAMVAGLWLLLGPIETATPPRMAPLAAGAPPAPARTAALAPAVPAVPANPVGPVGPVHRIGRDTLQGSAPGRPSGAATPPAQSAAPAVRPTAPGTGSRALFPPVPRTPPIGAAVTVAPADVRLFRTPTRAQVDPALQAAWTALREGRSAEAREAYLRLENTLPGNVDVQLGLASLAAEQGQLEEARARYQRALVQDPLNQAAQAGLALLAPAGSNPALDSQLRSRAAAQDSDARFALAARLSSAGQWPDAEQAWFDALQGDPDNPDTLYNLAVALDHLHQPNAAIQHYRSALEAAGRRHARFERSAVEQRLRTLTQP